MINSGHLCEQRLLAAVLELVNLVPIGQEQQVGQELGLLLAKVEAVEAAVEEVQEGPEDGEAAVVQDDLLLDGLLHAGGERSPEPGTSRRYDDPVRLQDCRGVSLSDLKFHVGGLEAVQQNKAVAGEGAGDGVEGSGEVGGEVEWAGGRGRGRWGAGRGGGAGRGRVQETQLRSYGS